ncbi:MAG: Periplasmic sensor signal transduction histidine kinase precursor [Acidobacteria bacterium]|nr:Periplasmic sensor signal transduction histidine kinase precursor [Acidobacteriota bacterium]
MHRLHVKIFLWFWLGVLVVTGTLWSLTELSYTRADDDRRWAEKYTPRVHLWARQEMQILRREGPGALDRYIGSFQSDPGVLNYIFDADGRELLQRDPSPPVLRLVTSMADWPSGTPRVDADERIIAERIVDSRGVSHVVVIDFPGPSVLNRSVVEFLSPDFYAAFPDRGWLIRAAAVLTVAGVFCFVLARHIARPIDRLRLAARNIANQQLHTRVDASVLQRKDELADLGRDFDRMAERIEHLVTAQRHLLADVSHALRSPLARLNVALGLARQRNSQPTSEHLDRIETEAVRLNKLIGQLLTMARMDSGLDLERPTRFDLGSVVEEVSTDADYEARQRGCAVAFSQRGACAVEGAREMLRGAIENVVRNAVRHTEAATRVEVSLECRHEGDRARAIIEVRDHGPGVPEDAVANLFVPFNRVLNDGVSNPERTGLGLAITRRTFEVHGGSATAANAPGGGFIVTLALPLPA